MMFGQFHFAPGLWCENQDDLIGKTGWNLQYILSFLLSVQDTWAGKESDPEVPWPRENRSSCIQDIDRPAGLAAQWDNEQMFQFPFLPDNVQVSADSPNESHKDARYVLYWVFVSEE